MVTDLELLLAEGKIIEATDLLVDHLDRCCSTGAFEEIQELLRTIALEDIPLQVLGGVYMVCCHAKKELGEDFTNLEKIVFSRVPNFKSART